MVVAFYFLILRPQKKRQQAIQKTMAELTPGTRVLLGSGLFGTIVSLGDRQAVLEIAPGVELTVLKQAINRVVTDADEDTVLDDGYADDDLVDEPLAEPNPAAPVTPENERKSF
jgi:preprotein translocase subunit YajC